MKSLKKMLVLASASGLIALAQQSRAAVLTWDIDSSDGATITPGSGTWDLATPNWNDGATNIVWPNISGTNGADAIFAGADGTYAIDVASSLNVNNLKFNNSGYTLSASTPKTITLAGQLNIAPDKTATIGNNVTINRGAAYNVQGGGTLNIDSGGVVTGSGNPLAILTPTNVLPGGTLKTTGSTSIAISVNAPLTVSGGTVAPAGLLVIANASNATGTITLDTGAINLDPAAGLRVAGGSTNTITNTTATFNLNGGTLTTPKIYTGLGSAANGIFNFNGGTLKANATNSVFMKGLAAANVQAGGAIIDTQANSITIAQQLLHEAVLGATPDGGLQKLGAGTLTLTGANTYTGPTSVSAGTLLVNANHSNAGAYTVTGDIGTPATLGGSGTIGLASALVNAAVSSTSPHDNGILAPGATPGALGTLTVDGGTGVVLGNNSTLLTDYADGGSSDLLAITGGGNLDLTAPTNTLSLVGSGTGTYTIAQFAGYNGPAALNQFETVLLNGQVAQDIDPSLPNYAAVTYNPGNISVTVAVPEPGALALLGLGAMAMGNRRRRNRTAARVR
jgi:autotransporter-associated beta strand protein